MLTDKQTDKNGQKEQMELHQFRKEPIAYDGNLSPCQV